FAAKNWDVAIHYNSSEKSANETVSKIKAMKLNSIAVKADIRKKEEIQNAFEKVISEFGIPDVLVNNAGIFPQAYSTKDLPEEVWDSAMDINLKAHFLFSQVFAKYAHKNSRIVNIASIGGLEIWKQRIPYNISKAAAIKLTKALARDLAPLISVNCVCPGTVDLPDDSNAPAPKKVVSVKDIFDAVYFFATTTPYITGQMLLVDSSYFF
ncbi:MAG: SDR family oxidoreductase, partial [FCB group bacterium]